MAHRRRVRLDRRQVEARAQKQVNAVRKAKERTRRDARILEIVREGSPPLTPDVLSWLSRKLDKRTSQITADDVATLVR